MPAWGGNTYTTNAQHPTNTRTIGPSANLALRIVRRDQGKAHQKIIKTMKNYLIKGDELLKLEGVKLVLPNNAPDDIINWLLK